MDILTCFHATNIEINSGFVKMESFEITVTNWSDMEYVDGIPSTPNCYSITISETR
jgi:hypothetical protein